MRHISLCIIQCSGIEFFIAENVPPNDNHQHMKAIYREECLHISIFNVGLHVHLNVTALVEQGSTPHVQLQQRPEPVFIIWLLVSYAP